MICSAIGIVIILFDFFLKGVCVWSMQKKIPCWCILHLWKDLLEALQILKNSHVIWTVEPLIFFFLNFKFCGENLTLFWPNEWIYFCCFSCISDIYWIYYGLTIGFMKCCPSQVFRSIEEKYTNGIQIYRWHMLC